METINYYQQKFWDEIVDTKYSIYYFECYKQYYEKIDLRIKYFLGITSSSSIASWAVWREYDYIFGIIIAISQVINAIKHFFPFETKFKKLQALTSEYERIYLIANNDWYYVSEGLKTTEEINMETTKIKKLKLDAESKYFDNSCLKDNHKIYKKAEQKLKIYYNQ